MTNSEQLTKALEQTISQQVQQSAKKVAEEKTFEEGPLLPTEARAKKHEHELSQYVQYAKRRCSEGFHLCHGAVAELANSDTTINLEALDRDITSAFSRFDETAHVLEMSQQAAGGTSWKDLLGLSDTSMQLLYNGAKDLFEKKRYPEAEACFFFLTTVDFSQYAFWLGLGHAAFQLGNINQAINAYETADCCQPGSVWPHIYMANCFETLHDHEESLIALEEAQKEHDALDTQDPEIAQGLSERIHRLKAQK